MMPAVCLAGDNSRFQLVDDVELLRSMIAEEDAQLPLYQATNYWLHYRNAVRSELMERGLGDFRQRAESHMRSFGATEPLPALFDGITIQFATAQDKQMFDAVTRGTNDFLRQDWPLLPFRMTLTEQVALGASWLDAQARLRNMPSPLSLDLARHGNAAGFEINGRFWPPSFFKFFARYLYVGQFVNFDELELLIEIGGGLGIQIEILKKLHPQLTIINLDLAEQLYVAERYLSKALPDSCQPYRPGDAKIVRGKVHFWHVARIEALPAGKALGWAAATLSSLEPSSMANYAHHLQRVADRCYMVERFEGKEQGAPGQGGVLVQMQFADYRRAFQHYELVDRSPAHAVFAPEREGTHPYENSFWRRF